MGQIADLNEITTLAGLATGDLMVVRDISDAADKDKKLQMGKLAWKDSAAILTNRVASWKDANTLMDAGFLVTDVPLKSAANTFTANNNFSATVGIGTVTAPFNLLHVQSGAVSGADANADDYFVLEHNGNTSFNIISSTVGIGQFCFSDDVRAMGLFQYNHNINALTMRTNGTTSMTLDAAGAPSFPLMAVLAGTAVHASAGGTLTKATSSRKYKRNIRDLSDEYGDNLIRALRPVLYQDRHGFVKDADHPAGEALVEYGAKDKSPDRVGLISEEVYSVSGEAFVMLDANGKPDGLSYER